MFNKDRLKQYLKDLKINENDYIIIAGGSLVMQNIKETTEDIDLDVSKKAFDVLAKKFDVHLSSKPYPKHYYVNDDVEVVLVDDLSTINRINVDGFYCTTLEDEYKWKKEHAREKDKEILSKIEEILSTKEVR